MSWSVAAAAASMLVACATAQDVPAVPPGTEIGTTGYCTLTPGWEYAPRYNLPAPDTSADVTSIEECAMVCAENEFCTGATYLDGKPDKNCWMKSWALPPAPAGAPCWAGENAKFEYNAVILKNGATCADLTYVEESVDCKTDAMIEEGTDAALVSKTGAMVEEADAPIAAAVAPAVAPAVAMPAGGGDINTAAGGVYVSHPGFDVVIDAEGSVVDSDVACAEACDALATCNAAAYYGEMEADWPAKKNCWLKTLPSTCALPADAEATPVATLLLKMTADCPATAAAATGVAAGPAGAVADPMAADATAVAPGGVAPLTTAPVADSTATIEGPPTAEGPVSTRDFESETATTGTDTGATTADTTTPTADPAVDPAADPAVVSAAPHGVAAVAAAILAAAGALLL